MAPLLANVLLWTARRGYTNATQVSGPANAYLAQVPAHIEPNTANALALSDAAIKAPYYLTVDSGTDIVRETDSIYAITLMDGVTPWPGDVAAANTGIVGQDVTTWVVVDAREGAPGFLPVREVFIDRLTTRGPSHP